MAETQRVAIIAGAAGGNRQGNDAGSAGGRYTRRRGRSRSGAVAVLAASAREQGKGYTFSPSRPT
jgi:stringent starvation protein B